MLEDLKGNGYYKSEYFRMRKTMKTCHHIHLLVVVTGEHLYHQILKNLFIYLFIYLWFL
jgi:hypothetical protein